MPNLPIFVKPQAKMQMKTSSPWPISFFCHSLLHPAPKGPLKLVYGHSNPCEKTLLGHFIDLGCILQNYSVRLSSPSPSPTQEYRPDNMLSQSRNGTRSM